MADYMTWQETTVSQVFCLDTPSNATEVTKMLAGAYRKFADVHGREPYDDEVEVTTRSGSVVAVITLRSGKEP